MRFLRVPSIPAMGRASNRGVRILSRWTRGDWFWVASSSVLFGLGVIFLPFVVRAKPVQKWLEGTKKAVVVLVADAVLFLNMMNCIRLHNQQGTGSFLLAAGCAAGITLLVLNRMKNGREKQ